MENMNFNPTGDNQEKTFTQDDVNRIVGERLAKEKSKADAEYSKRETELTRRELQITARELLSSKNMPAELLDAINCTDNDTVRKSVDIIEKFVNDRINNAQPQQLRGLEPISGGTAPADMSDRTLRAAMGLDI